MKIPLSMPDVTELEISQVLEVLRTPTLSLGPKLPEFEQRMAQYVGRKHAIAVNSGTSALHLAVRTLGIGDGDEVITTPFSFVSSANCLLFERARPVFVDIDPLTFNINVNKVEEQINKKTKAILAVDVFGYPADWPWLEEIAEKHNLGLIEDSCEALGAEYRGKKTGSFGDAAVFSFYPNKQMTTGEGGVIATDDDHIAMLCRSMRNQGREEGGEWLEHRRLGYNYRISDINCALGIAQLERLEEILAKRAEVACWYDERLRGMDRVMTPFSSSEVKRSWFVYVVLLSERFDRKERDRIMHGLKEAGIGCQRYFSPIHLQSFYAEMFGYRRGDFPVAEYVADRTLALPFFNRLTEEQIDEVVQNLQRLL